MLTVILAVPTPSSLDVRFSVLFEKDTLLTLTTAGLSEVTLSPSRLSNPFGRKDMFFLMSLLMSASLPWYSMPIVALAN